MKITEHKPISIPKSKLDAFSQRKFTLELDGFQMLALYYISGKIGGSGKTRQVFVFSDGGDDFNTRIGEVEGVDDAMREFRKYVDVDADRPCIYTNDKLPI